MRAAWSEAPMQECLPFAGWNLCRENPQGLTFATMMAYPDKAGGCSLRRGEVIASRNLAGQHWWVTDADDGGLRCASASDLSVPALGLLHTAVLDWRARPEPSPDSGSTADQ
ncbi:hypothetical protein GCM10010201_33150 [Pilimelia columellifera subsp. columellifera]|uniref:Uncharacterized protein n=1 Tax=Pilimelia columellifera subsp. columellifera TaxID=706583 RepID=A0ABP6B0N1_9ACTN